MLCTDFPCVCTCHPQVHTQIYRPCPSTRGKAGPRSPEEDWWHVLTGRPAAEMRVGRNYAAVRIRTNGKDVMSLADGAIVSCVTDETPVAASASAVLAGGVAAAGARSYRGCHPCTYDAQDDDPVDTKTDTGASISECGSASLPSPVRPRACSCPRRRHRRRLRLAGRLLPGSLLLPRRAGGRRPRRQPRTASHGAAHRGDSRPPGRGARHRPAVTANRAAGPGPSGDRWPVSRCQSGPGAAR